MKKKCIPLAMRVMALPAVVPARRNRPGTVQPDSLSLPAPVLLSPDADKNTGSTTSQFRWPMIVGTIRCTFAFKNAAENSMVNKKNFHAETCCDLRARKIPSPEKFPIGKYWLQKVAWTGKLKTEWRDYHKPATHKTAGRLQFCKVALN